MTLLKITKMEKSHLKTPNELCGVETLTKLLYCSKSTMFSLYSAPDLGGAKGPGPRAIPEEGPPPCSCV